MKRLEWKNYDSISSSSFKNLYDDDLFTDVTLACEGNKKIEAHKVILSACSNFFQEILQDNEHPHPLIYMQGMDIKYLTLLKKFMYLGEAMVEQDYVVSFVQMSKNYLNTEENHQNMQNKHRNKQELGHNNSTQEETIDKQINMAQSSRNLSPTENKLLADIYSNVEQFSGENTSKPETTIHKQISLPERVLNISPTENKFLTEFVAKVEQSLGENDSKISINPKLQPTSSKDIVNKKEITPIEFIPRMKQLCLKCKFKSFNYARLQDHIERMHSEQLCPECGISLEVGKLKKHLRNLHTTYSCEDCSFTTEKQEHYYFHKRTHIKDGLIRCDQCEYNSYSNFRVKRHREIHNTSNEFKCKSCNFTSKTQDEQKYHNNKIHKGVRHKCEDCNYSTVQGNNLNAHRISVHAKLKTFCGFCPFSKSSVSRVRLHEKRKHYKEVEKCISNPPLQDVSN